MTHGTAHLLEGGEVAVAAGLDDDTLVLVVRNPRDPEAPRSRGAGLGLENVRRRVAAFYGTDGQTLVRRGERDFVVELRLPLRTSGWRAQVRSAESFAGERWPSW